MDSNSKVSVIYGFKCTHIQYVDVAEYIFKGIRLVEGNSLKTDHQSLLRLRLRTVIAYYLIFLTIPLTYQSLLRIRLHSVIG